MSQGSQAILPANNVVSIRTSPEMKRKTQDAALEGPEEASKRFVTNWPVPDEFIDTEADTLQSTADSNTDTPQPSQTDGATSITAVSRASRKFPSDLKTIKCTFAGCPKTFNRPARLAAHLRSHTNDRPHKCPYSDCDKDYLEEKHLTQHIKGSHTHEKKYTCEEPGCGKSFVTATRLRRHAAVHTGAERYRCRGYEGCNETFRKHQTLQRHIRTAHLGQCAYPCGNDGCQSGFDTASALKRHITRDHGELKFWCDECGKSNGGDDDEEPRRVGFTTLLLLQAHMRREHINCMFCDVKCGTQFDLERHIDLYHSGTTVEERKTVECTWEGCNRKFTRVSNLNTHIKTAHKGLRFVCGQVNTFDVTDIADWNWMEEGCGQDFVSKLKLEEHVRFVHLGRKRPPRVYTAATAGFAVGMVDEVSGNALPRDIACTYPDCDATFARHHDLNQHIKYEHSMDSMIDGSGPETCPNGESPQVQEDMPAEETVVVPINGDVSFAIDPLLQQQSDMLIPVPESTIQGGDGQPGHYEFWPPQDEQEDTHISITLQQRSPTFDTDWAEMRRLIDLDALVDKK